MLKNPKDYTFVFFNVLQESLKDVNQSISCLRWHWHMHACTHTLKKNTLKALNINYSTLCEETNLSALQV